MTPGGYISATVHVVFIAWLLAGWGLDPEPLDFQVTPVTAVSEAEYAAVMARSTSPQPEVEPAAPAEPPPETVEEPPVVEEAPPEPVVEEPPEPPAPVDEPPAPLEEPPPPVVEEPPPAAVVEPAPPVETPPAPPPSAAVAEAVRPMPRPAPRVSPDPAPPPPPEVEEAPVVEEPMEPTPEPTPEPVVEEPPPEPSAPPEAAPEVVTEAEPPSGAVDSAMRPPARPRRQAPRVEEPEETQVAAAEPEPERAPDPEPEPARAPDPEPEPAGAPSEASNSDVADDDVLAALEAAAGSDATAAAADPGPPMTSGEKDAFRLAVQSCWNVAAVSSEAGNTIVTVQFELGRDGKVIRGPDLVETSGAPSEAAARSAFEAARRAIVRCGAGGFPLPPEKYEQWRDVLMTFNPVQGTIQ